MLPLEPRRLTAADAADFRRLRLDAVRRHPDLFRYSEADELALDDAAAAERLERAFVVGLYVVGDLAAAGGLSIFEGSKLSHRGLVWGMYVAPELRGTGASDAILGALFERARGRCGSLLLTVVEHNAPARAFYERHGFQLIGREPRAVRVGDGFVDELTLWRALTASGPASG